jgi:hypothetical protein
MRIYRNILLCLGLGMLSAAVAHAQTQPQDATFVEANRGNPAFHSDAPTSIPANAASNDPAPTFRVHTKTIQLIDLSSIGLLDFRSEGTTVNSGESASDFLTFEQVPVASACYTYAGPICPMRVAVPIGWPCTCYYPDGALRGVAR